MKGVAVEEDVVRARRFELVDDEGTVCAVLTARSEDGHMGMHLANAEGRTIAYVAVEKENRIPFISLKDSEGKNAVVLTVTNDAGTLTLSDAGGRERLYSPIGAISN
jgi:hypothetical protein